MAYWLGTYVLDYIKYLFFAILCPLILLWMDTDLLIEDGNIEYITIFVFTWGFAVLPFSYFISFKFKTQASCNVTLFLFTFITGFVLPLMAYIFGRVGGSFETAGDIITYIFRYLTPTFCFGDSLFKIAFTSVISFSNGYTEPLNVWDPLINRYNYYAICI